MRQLRLLVATLLAVSMLVAPACGDDGGESADTGDTADTDATADTGDTAEPDDTAQPDDTSSASTTSVPCPDPAESTTTTAGAPTAGAPTLCGLLEDLPPEDRAAIEDAEPEEIWDGDVSGTLQPPGCAPVSQTGGLVLVVDEGGELWAAGTTFQGAYTCDNGASIPEMAYNYLLTGEKTDRFTLNFEDGTTITSDPIVRDATKATQDTGIGTITIELTCLDCSEEGESGESGEESGG